MTWRPMYQQPVLILMKKSVQATDFVLDGEKELSERSTPIVHSHSEPTPTLSNAMDIANDRRSDKESRNESRDVLCTPLVSVPLRAHIRVAGTGTRRSGSTLCSSPTTSRPSSPCTASRPSLTSTATSASLFTIDLHPEHKQPDTPSRRPSILSRLRSSISATSAIQNRSRRPSVHPCDFRKPPEYPEKHFIDSVGMVIPGVCNRNPCSHPLSHFVINWRLCEPIEYTTALADHGITYTDYCLLLTALANFVDEMPNELKRKPRRTDWWWNPKHWGSNDGSREDLPEDLEWKSRKAARRHDSIDSLEQFKKSERKADALNGLLADITFNWRARGLPVMVCIGSFSLFAPNCISESHVQILHVALEPRNPLEGKPDVRPGQRLSFVDPFTRMIKTHELEDYSVSVPQRNLSQRSQRSNSPPSPHSHGNGNIFHHHQLQLRDRTRPWPLWPNAIPSCKRGLIDGHADRYGVDPYFRAWMRANINSRTRSTSYAKYMIEREDDPFVNRRMPYIDGLSRTALLRAFFSKGLKLREDDRPSKVNRDHYEHNRRLECRKTVEHSSRLRIIRFAFRNPIYPPHTPEMEELGLSYDAYTKIIYDIEYIRRSSSPKNKCGPRIPLLSNLPLGRRSAEDSVAKVSEYVRHVNAQQSKIVWTIEKIPGVYERRFGRTGKEWEVSAWNAEDPLELLLQLERWGIIEKGLDIDDDD
ncbi:hypothetical protein B0J11DRAFT_100786 [Dendryphion nanum]|uniref:Uncharacterized protein n=1 Tax=Dendryphion nanum TaxID=256645 RepID=A0A9P9DD17_9PLEO|nr:hypothetical protein B0J11DRAFT_100786 [Dendryphion nanum]